MAILIVLKLLEEYPFEAFNTLNPKVQLTGQRDNRVLRSYLSHYS